MRVGAPEPADLRAGFDGLAALVTSRLGRDPLSGHLFLFVNRNRTRAKVLVWDGTGLCIYAKRLEHGRFASLWKERAAAVELTTSEARTLSRGLACRRAYGTVASDLRTACARLADVKLRESVFADLASELCAC